MRIGIDLTRTLEENAATYFDKAKKAKSKKEGAEKAVERSKEKLAKEQDRTQRAQQQAELKRNPRHWYHKYRWSYTRNGHLLVGGPNADANESLIKHQTQENDYVLHTDMAGSPFVILRPEGEVTDEDLEDAGTLVACYSRAWQKGMGTADVFWVRPEQVTKEAQSGEFLPKGAFMVRGETNYVHPVTELGVGVITREGYQPEVFAGSRAACEEHCERYAVIVPGNEKTSDVAKELSRRFGGALDGYVKAIPAGGSRILKQ